MQQQTHLTSNKIPRQPKKYGNRSCFARLKKNFILKCLTTTGVPEIVFINWPAVNAPVEVNLLITTAKAPITLMLLFWFSLLFVIVIYILFVQQTGSFATMRRLTKELQEQRKLATDQEASRLTDVKADFEKKWQIWMEEQKQILSQTEQRLSDRQNKILEAFKGTEDQIAAANKELNASITGTLDTMDDKITKILIANKNPDQQQ